MSELSDSTLGHLRELAQLPDLGSTRYELVHEIGRGGMGSVYLAHDGELERTVAIKIVHAAAFDAEATQRLRREARILARLEHPGIVPVYDAGELPDGRAFYAMKHIAGERLDEFARGPHEGQERLRVFGRICEAVASAHAQGVLHRDLKPANVHVGAYGEVLVLDFGVAKLLDAVLRPEPPHAASQARAQRTTATTTATEQGTIVGTPGYMAPEQARGEVGELDVRADVYALGAILRFMLTGAMPRETPTTHASPDGARWRTSYDAQHVARPLEAIARKALAFERSERYASVALLLEDVHRYTAQLPVSAYSEPLPARLARLAARHKTPIVLVLAYLAVRLALIFFHPD